MARPSTSSDIVGLGIDDHSDAGEDAAFLPPRNPTRTRVHLDGSQQHKIRRGFVSTKLSRLGNGIVTKPAGISAIMCLAVFLWVMSGMVAVIPAMQMMEELFCRRYYRDSLPDRAGQIRYGDDDYERLCKAVAVQSVMAYVGGITSLIDSFVGVVLAFPFGILADRARRPVYMLGALGQLLNVCWSLGVFYFSNIFPVELVLLGPLFSIVGGGLPTAVAILFAVISDVHRPEDRANWYFFFSLAAQAAIFVGPPSASALMGAFSPWAPLMLSPVFTATAGLIMLLVPETARSKGSVKKASPRTQHIDHTAQDNHVYGHEDIDNPTPNVVASDENPEDTSSDGIWQQIGTNDWLVTFRTHFRTQLSETSTVFRDLLRQRSVVLLLLVFMLAAPLGKGLGQTFVQYVSKRYHKSIEEVGYLFALRGGLTLVVMGGLLPLVSYWLSRSSSRVVSPSASSSSPSCPLLEAQTGGRKVARSKRPVSPFARDLLLAQLSAFFSLLGFFGLDTPSYPVLVSSLAVESLGSGLLPLCRSMITNFTTAAHTSSLFTLVSVVETLGGMPAGLVLAWLFSTGMKLAGEGGEAREIWYGLPFVYLGTCALACLMALLFLKPPRSSPWSPASTMMASGSASASRSDETGPLGTSNT